MIREREYHGLPGIPVLITLIAVEGLLVWLLVQTIQARNPVPITATSLALGFITFLMFGHFMVNPNEGKVLQLFGAYRGTAKLQGLRWANPLLMKKAVSLRIRNFESGRLKVNDSDGNPVEIAAVVVWKVVETAEAVFEVDDYENYVHVQTESALRNLTTSYPYDAHDDQLMSLRGHTSAVADHLKREIQDRLNKAGVEVVEARIAARQKIVEGAVGMVEMALDMLSQKKIVELDDERKAAMVSNLLVVLCGERGAQPILNTGTIYQ